jgi:hypothetical protein
MPEKTILAIGGAVIKTAREDLLQYVAGGSVEILIHNGGSLFHDFQIAQLPHFQFAGAPTSYPLDLVLDDYKKYTLQTSFDVNAWIEGEQRAPQGSVTALCESLQIPVLLFTGFFADFWQLGLYNLHSLADFTQECFEVLCKRFRAGPFYFLLMGSAVIHPEVFTKALAVTKPQKFKADVVDFKEMFRPRTRVAKYGEYFLTTHKKFLQQKNKPLYGRLAPDPKLVSKLLTHFFTDRKEDLLMDAISFVMKILTLRTRWEFSVTSWGRTVKHNADVGGVPGSDHLLWLGLDVIMEPPGKNFTFEKDCIKLGLTALDEKSHYHIRPSGL